MTLPEYNESDDAPKLVLFYAVADNGLLIYPLSPEGLFSPSSRGAHVLVATRGEEDKVDSSIYTMKDMMHAFTMMDFLVNHPWLQGGTVCTLHPNRMLSRMLHWRALAGGMRPGPAAPLAKPVDLVEAFHGPAILTFNERAEFHPGLVAGHLGLPFDIRSPESAAAVLLHLCYQL